MFSNSFTIRLIIFLLLINIFCYSQKYTIVEVDSLNHKLVGNGKIESAVDVNLKALKYFKSESNKEGIASVLIHMASIMSNYNKYQESNGYLDQAKKELGGINNPLLEAKLLTVYGINNSLVGLYKQGNQTFDKVIKLTKKISDQKEKDDLLYYSYGWKWYNFETLNEVDSLYSMQSKSMKLSPRPLVSLKIADRFLMQNKHLDSAEYYLNKAVILNKKNDIYIKATTLLKFGDLYALKNENEKALSYYLKSLEISKKVKVFRDIRSVYLEISNVYTAMNNPKKAKEYQELYTALDEEIKRNDKKTLQNIVDKLIQEKENEEKEKKNKLYIFIALILTAFSLIFYFVRKNYLKKQKESTEIIEEKVLETDTLKRKLDTSFDKLVKLARNRDPFFLKSFKKLYPEFYDKLISINPDLTDNEIKLCAYLKLKLNTKEITQYENITARTIETKKYRLKKKLGLTSEENLIKWLSEL
ncbi:hypothetical protein [Chryseobacterium sp. G0201]|uniref:hypothetical protein n=1 Tax=Chryseobacterium sp. G0201 TaxID=2487065 RepID=UPI000F4FFC84|nr:hypothetical protein [Chryseobacterium sp. G0201]AZA54794.1 hypothetical protein EG348_18200 [Chryseobacterium sp. G0201]